MKCGKLCAKVGAKVGGKAREKKTGIGGKVDRYGLSTVVRRYPQSYPQRFPLGYQAFIQKSTDTTITTTLIYK